MRHTTLASLIVLSALTANCGSGMQLTPETVSPVLAMADAGLEALTVPEELQGVTSVLQELMPVGQAAVETWAALDDGERPDAWYEWVVLAATAVGHFVAALEHHGLDVPCWASALATVLASAGGVASCPLE